VILLDEVEKAHPDVFNVLLQVLDDGRLTDGQGRTVDFRNTVIIMTSNLGSDVIQKFAGESNYTAMKDAVMEVVQENFRPESINRIDDICVFHPLGTANDFAPSSTSAGAAQAARLADRNLELQLDDRRWIVSAKPLRPGVRRAPFEARHPAAGGEPAGAGHPLGQVPAWGSHPRQGQRQRAGFREALRRTPNSKSLLPVEMFITRSNSRQIS
jgi:hypothetical protein